MRISHSFSHRSSNASLAFSFPSLYLFIPFSLFLIILSHISIFPLFRLLFDNNSFSFPYLLSLPNSLLSTYFSLILFPLSNYSSLFLISSYLDIFQPFSIPLICTLSLVFISLFHLSLSHYQLLSLIPIFDLLFLSYFSFSFLFSLSSLCISRNLL